MSRQNPHVTTIVDGTLTDSLQTYHVRVQLGLLELWGTNIAPDDYTIESENVILPPGVPDGHYVLRYSFGNKDFKFNRQVRAGRVH